MQAINTVPKQGDHGKDVVFLQKALNNQGISLTVDGLFAAKTVKAVSDFQKRKGLPGSGIIGPKTLNLLGLTVVAISPVTGRVSVTRNLVGKKENRVLHPTLRLLLEDKVFPNGMIPRCFVEKDVAACGTMVAFAFAELSIREIGGNNKGAQVGQIQSIIGSYNPQGNGDAWCMSTMQCIVAFVEDYFQIESPVEDAELCTAVFRAAKSVPDLIAEDLLEAGAMFVGQHGKTSKGHTGWNVKIKSKYELTTIEGNTSSNGVGGLFPKEQDIRKIGDLKLLGSIRIYPNNNVNYLKAG